MAFVARNLHSALLALPYQIRMRAWHQTIPLDPKKPVLPLHCAHVRELPDRARIVAMNADFGRDTAYVAHFDGGVFVKKSDKCNRDVPYHAS